MAAEGRPLAALEEVGERLHLALVAEAAHLLEALVVEAVHFL